MRLKPMMRKNNRPMASNNRTIQRSKYHGDKKIWRIARRNVLPQRLGRWVFVVSGVIVVDVVSVPSSFIDEIGSSGDCVGDEASKSSASGVNKGDVSSASAASLGRKSSGFSLSVWENSILVWGGLQSLGEARHYLALPF